MLPGTSHTATTSPAAAPLPPTTGHPLVTQPELQEIATTASRQLTSPEDFLFAVRWAVAQGWHPRSTSLTVTVAEEMARRMNRQGHMAYGREHLAAQLGLSLSTVRNHTRVLRELGLLVWVEHGSRRNVLRAKNPHSEPGRYKATGTIFAAVAPPSWDRMMGRVLCGTGYSARLTAVTGTGRRYEAHLAELAAHRRNTKARPHTPRPGAGRTCPPSVSGFSILEQLKADGEFNNTRTRASHTSATPRRAPGTLSRQTPQPVTPGQTADFIARAQTAMRHVGWLSRCAPRRLAFVLRPLLLRGIGQPQLHRLLRTLTPTTPVRGVLGFLAYQVARLVGAAPEQRVDGPLGWVPAGPLRPSPVELPRCEPRDTPQVPSIAAHLSAGWDAYHAEAAFRALRIRLEEGFTDARHHEELVPVYPPSPPVPADEEGTRWRAMVDQRRDEQERTFAATAALRADLRTLWPHRRASRPSRARAVRTLSRDTRPA